MNRGIATAILLLYCTTARCCQSVKEVVSPSSYVSGFLSRRFCLLRSANRPLSVLPVLFALVTLLPVNFYLTEKQCLQENKSAIYRMNNPIA